jgi:hypothetical protein
MMLVIVRDWRRSRQAGAAPEGRLAGAVILLPADQLPVAEGGPSGRGGPPGGMALAGARCAGRDGRPAAATPPVGGPRYPTSASWLNAVGDFVSTPTQRRLRRKRVHSAAGPEQATARYIRKHNAPSGGHSDGSGPPTPSAPSPTGCRNLRMSQHRRQPVQQHDGRLSQINFMSFSLCG